ncbi:MAG: SBBP repeat-containing protein, partial [bacterium]
MKNLKLNLLVLICILVLTCEMSFAQVIQDWVKSYSSPQLNAQIAYDVVTDTAGNVYVTGTTSRGYSTYDMVTLKYNAAGGYVWGKTFNSTTTDYSNEVGRSIALYKNGDSTFLYCAGMNTSHNNIIVIKYNQNGNQLWQKTYSTSPNGYLHTVPKVLTDASGNCYVSGSNGQSPFLIKYNSAGTIVFSTIVLSDPGHVRAKASDMAFDAAGNIYLTGDIDSSGSNAFYYYTMKLNTAGVLQWKKYFRGSTNYQSRANEIAVGGSGNIYVTGEYSTNGILDYLTIKYNPLTGDTLWTRKYEGTGNSSDQGKVIALDANENVFVSGETFVGSYTNIVTVKYNSSGVQQWAKTYAGPGAYSDYVKDIIIDNSGNIYITGASDYSYFGKYLTMKYNQNGDVLWTNAYDFAVPDFEIGYAMTLDNSGNVIVTGSSGYENISDFGTIKYNSSGVVQWAKKFYGAQLVNDVANGVVTDKKGNVYVVGRIRTNLGDNINIIKYNSSGVEKWVYNRGGTIAGYDVYDEAKAITVDTSGNVYFTGTVFLNSSYKQEIVTGKIDSNGNNLWYTISNSINTDDAGNSIEVDNSGNVYVAGQTAVGTDLNYMTVKYNSAGVVQWTKFYAGASGGNDVPKSIAVDGNGNIFVTGKSEGAGTGSDIATVKYNS